MADPLLHRRMSFQSDVPPDSTPFNSGHADGSTASTWNQQIPQISVN
jgi:hypothetical protein